MQHNTNSINISADRIGWIVGVIGVIVGLTSLSMIWVTRDVSRVQSDQLEWMRDRINQLEGRTAVLEAYRSVEQQCPQPQ